LHISASCLALAAAAAAQSPATGRVTGHVRLTAHIRGKPLPSAVYQRRTIGDHDAPALPEIRNVVVYLKDVAHRGALPTTRTELRQEHETFLPHTLAVTRGSTVEFPNGDPFFHNVFSLSRAATFNLGRYDRGQTRAREFTKSGIVKVYCDIHSHMSATILVFDHPYFTIPSLDGTFELDDVPPGEYTIIGWHERVGERAERIRVESGKTASIDLTVPVPPTDGGDGP
jgi:plastocyanin